MSYSQVNLILSLPTLIKRINKKGEPNHVTQITSGVSNNDGLQIYIKLNNMSHGYWYVTVNENGEVYNPMMPSYLLVCVFDWLKHIDQKRQTERVDKFKMELIERTWHPDYINNVL